MTCWQLRRGSGEWGPELGFNPALLGARPALTGAGALTGAVPRGLCGARPAPEVAARKPKSKRAFPAGGSALEHDLKGSAGNSFPFDVLGSGLGDVLRGSHSAGPGSADPVPGSRAAPGPGPTLLRWRVPVGAAEAPGLAQSLWGCSPHPQHLCGLGLVRPCWVTAVLLPAGGCPRYGRDGRPSPSRCCLPPAVLGSGLTVVLGEGSAPAPSGNLGSSPAPSLGRSCELSPGPPSQQLGQRRMGSGTPGLPGCPVAPVCLCSRGVSGFVIVAL